MAQLQRRLLIDLYLGSLLHFLLKPPVMLLGKTIRRNHDLGKVRDVTYVKLLGGGSIVMAYPSLLALKQSGRINKLRLLATNKTAAFGRALGVFDEIIMVRDHNALTLAWDALKAIVHLRRVDATVDLEIHSRLSTVLCVLTLARNRIGAYTENSFWRRGLSTHLLFYNKSAPVFAFYEQIVELFGLRAETFAQAAAVFQKQIMAKTLDVPETSPTDLALAPCCSDLGRERMLRDEDWPIALAPYVSQTKRIHLLGSRNDRAYLDQLATRLAVAFPQVTFVNQAGELSLEQSVTLLGRISTLICIDSALLHFARLMGVATVSYWGPTDPATRIKPRAHKLDIIHYHRIRCSPCVHIANVAPCQGDNICMRFAANAQCGLNENPIWLLELPHAHKDVKNA